MDVTYALGGGGWGAQVFRPSLHLVCFCVALSLFWGKSSCDFVHTLDRLAGCEGNHCSPLSPAFSTFSPNYKKQGDKELRRGCADLLGFWEPEPCGLVHGGADPGRAAKSFGRDGVSDGSTSGHKRPRLLTWWQLRKCLWSGEKGGICDTQEPGF